MEPIVYIVQVTTLEEAQYYIKIQHRITDEYYSHSENFSFYGTGQGNRKLPVLCIVIRSCLLEKYQKQSKGVILETQDKSINIKYCMMNFANDSSSQVNHFTHKKQNII